MHEGPHYRLRRLASTHSFDYSSDCSGEDDHAHVHVCDTSTGNFFMQPPDESSAVKYGVVVRDTLEMVNFLHMSLISMQNNHPLLEVLKFANSCRHVVNRLSEFISDPVLFAGSFAEYYLRFLRACLANRSHAPENIRYALGGGIPSIIRACENEREKIIEAKHLFRSTAADLTRFLREDDRIDARMVATHPFTLKNVQTLHLILHKFDQMDQFCRSYEQYFGHFQFYHLHSLLDDFRREAVVFPSQEEVAFMIDLWTRYERFTLHFPNELDVVTKYFQSSDGEYRVFSTGSVPASEDSQLIYSESLDSPHRWQPLIGKYKIPRDRVDFLKRETRRMKSWFCAKTWQYYHCIQFWLLEQKAAD